jgi:hypothetical protein
MNKFSLKESLLKLYERNYDLSINETIITITQKFDEQQLRLISHNHGIKLDKIIKLYFMEGVGFRCYNDKDNIYGKLPICNNIESFMNKRYLEFIKDNYS